jgi:glycogen synthase
MIVRIIFPTPEFVTEPASFDGGLARYLSRVTPILKTLGHDPIVLVAARQNDRLIYEGVPVIRVKTWHPLVALLDRATGRRWSPTLRWGWQGRCFARALAPWAGMGRPTVVQYPNYTAPARQHRLSVPAIVRLSSYQPLWARGHGNTASPAAMRQIERLETEGLQRATALFAPSRLIAEWVARETHREVDVIPSPFVPQGTTAGGETPRDEAVGRIEYLLFFGSLSPLKGVHVIAAMIGDLLAAHPMIHFVFAGRDFGYQGKPLWPQLRAAAGAAAERVHYLGRLESTRLARVVAHARLVVLPSVLDNLPNAALEAMGTGRPVVGTWKSSLDELITDGRDGFLCRREDPADLRAVIERALALPSAALEAVGTSARARAADFRPEVTVKQLVDYYERVLAQAHP